MNYGALEEKLSLNLKAVDSLDLNAAVVALLREYNQRFELLFVKRTETPTDPWSGQIAFPGGKRSPSDNDLKETIIRETCEETNINLRNACKLLGTLDPIQSIRRPKIQILPFVVLQLKEQKIELNDELENFFWIPVRELPKNNGTKQYLSKEYPAYVLENNVVWGITYKITSKLISMMEPFFVS